MKSCPYIGNSLGYVQFWVKSSVDLVLRAFVRVSRGVLARVSSPNEFIMCTRQSSMRVINVLSVNGADPFAELGFIVDPRKTKKRVKYLNDVVDQVNSILAPLIRKRTDQSQRKPVEYNIGQKLYPFHLEEKALIPDYSKRSGEPAISLWVLNFWELLNVAGTDLYK